MLIIVVIAIIILISKGSSKDEQKLLKIYNNLTSTQTYLFEIQENDDSKTIMAKKDGKTIIDQYTKDNHSTTLIKDDTTYFILHDRQEYYVYNQNNVEQNYLVDGLGEVIKKEYITEMEKIRGQKYYYEEYPGSTMFMMSSDLELDEANIKTRFYFDKDDKLIYVKTLYGNKQELLKIDLKEDVDDSIFVVPENYAEGY